MAAIAALDYGWFWWRHEQSIKMSRQALKDEMHRRRAAHRCARQRPKARELLSAA